MTHERMPVSERERVHRAMDEDFHGHRKRCRDFPGQKSLSASGEGIGETAGIVKSFIEKIGGPFVFWRMFGLPVVSGGPGHGGRQHVADEHMTVEGLREFEEFVTIFLYQMANCLP